MSASNEHLLWPLISPALPVGAFHFSQGLEQAVAAGWVHDSDSALAWIQGLLLNQLAVTDLPLLLRLICAWTQQDKGALLRWDQTSRALRETRELREQDRDMASALRRLATELDEPVPAAPAGYLAVFAAMVGNRRIAERSALQGFAWSWCENLVLVAVKLIPLGHLNGQRLLAELNGKLSFAVRNALRLEDADIGRMAHAASLASMARETQGTRLFRS